VSSKAAAKGRKNKKEKPAEQAIRGVSSRSGTAPPAEYRWKPGQSGNSAGRPPAGAVVKEWLNVMAGWPREEVTAVMNDPAAPSAKRAAARTWLDATCQDRTSSGAPVAGGELDRIMDRTDGKPVQNVDVRGEVSHRHVVQAAVARMMADPELLSRAESLGERLFDAPDDVRPEPGRN
jgi:hypothetical protein